MSEEVAKPEDGDESSMEDILSSIRDILSDDEEGAKQSSETDSKSEGGDANSNVATGDSESIAENGVDNEAAPETETESEVASEAEPDSEAVPDTKSDGEPKPENEVVPEEPSGNEDKDEVEAALDENVSAESQPQAEPIIEQQTSRPETVQTSVPPAMEAILELTPDMIATEIVSKPTATASTDVLSELAAAILDRRDIAVDTSRNQMTLEGIVREMLKPILREWLDRNLPYLIERLVKREIDLMVNRAERLED